MIWVEFYRLKFVLVSQMPPYPPKGRSAGATTDFPSLPGGERGFAGGENFDDLARRFEAMKKDT